MTKEKNALSGWGAEFPKIGLVENGTLWYLPLNSAVVKFNSDYAQVESTGRVLESNFRVRGMTVEEERAFQARVDAYSASK